MARVEEVRNTSSHVSSAKVFASANVLVKEIKVSLKCKIQGLEGFLLGYVDSGTLASGVGGERSASRDSWRRGSG